MSNQQDFIGPVYTHPEYKGDKKMTPIDKFTNAVEEAVESVYYAHEDQRDRWARGLQSGVGTPDEAVASIRQAAADLVEELVVGTVIPYDGNQRVALHEVTEILRKIREQATKLRGE